MLNITRILDSKSKKAFREDFNKTYSIFWDFIEKVKWEDENDTQRSRDYLEYNYSEDEINMMLHLFLTGIGVLIEKFEKSLSNEEQNTYKCCDECIQKAICNIISKGEKIYENCINLMGELTKDYLYSLTLKECKKEKGLHKIGDFGEVFKCYSKTRTKFLGL